VDQLGELTNGVTFIVFGAAIVGPVLADLTWQAALYGVLSLTVVRMLRVAISLLGTHARRPTVAFVGWFGPRGLASIVFTIIVLEDGGLPHASTITVAVVFTVVVSVYAHGLSAKPLTDRYASWYRAHRAIACPGWRAFMHRTSGGGAPGPRMQSEQPAVAR
jgi:NhaP-type Na+/H+ or K+/H+ antiporter